MAIFQWSAARCERDEGIVSFQSQCCVWPCSVLHSAEGSDAWLVPGQRKWEVSAWWAWSAHRWDFPALFFPTLLLF